MIINWKPNKLIKIPLHIQILNYFKKMITTGQWINGENLPSQEELAEIFDVNRSTISTVIEELKFKGYIAENEKAGTFISANNLKNLLYSNKHMIDNMLKTGILKRNNEIYREIENLDSDKMINLGQGTLDKTLYPQKKMKNLLTEVMNEMDELPYGNKDGEPELIFQIEKIMKNLSVDMDKNKILIVSGATQGLFIVVFGLLSKGNIIKTKLPSYVKSLEMFNAAGLKIDKLSKKINNPSVIYTIPTFHNPTGKVMNSTDREIFINKYASQNPIIEDDVFRDLWYEEEPPKPLKSYQGENIIYINSFSKTISPGLGVGWICADSYIIDKLSEIKHQIDSGTSIINQKLAAKWLESNEYNKNIKSLRKNLKDRRDLIESILNRDFSEVFSWKKPSGGYFYWLKSKDRIKGLKIFKQALKNGLIVYPGDMYGDNNSYKIRISFSREAEENIEKGMQILLKTMNELKYGL